MKKHFLLLIVLLSLCTFFSSTVSAKSVNDYYGYFEIDGGDFAIKGIEISQHKVAIVLNERFQSSDDAQVSQDPYAKLILDMKNTYVNEDGLTILDDESDQRRAPLAEQTYLNINFSDWGHFPNFQIEIINPEYLFDKDNLEIRYKGETMIKLKLNENKVLIDEYNNTFKYVD